MTDGEEPQLGDLLASDRRQTIKDAAGGHHDASLLIATIAARYSVQVEDLIFEIQGPSILAKIARDLIGGINEETRKKRGAPKKEEEAWKIYERIERGILCGDSVALTIRNIIDEDGGENALNSRHSTISKRYYRERSQREKIQLTDLFKILPARRSDQT